jgi:hypothetical protein
MDELFARIWDGLVGRAVGPLHLRLLIQPMTAAFLAYRAGAADARAGRPPFGIAVLLGRCPRAELIREAWNDVATLFLVALVIDALYQALTFHWVYLAQGLLFAALLALPTYLLVRGPTNRVLRRISRTPKR